LTNKIKTLSSSRGSY